VSTISGLLKTPSDAKPPKTFKFGFRYDPYGGADWCERQCDQQTGCDRFVIGAHFALGNLGALNIINIWRAEN